jgi:hypothetical protein
MLGPSRLLVGPNEKGIFMSLRKILVVVVGFALPLGFGCSSPLSSSQNANTTASDPSLDFPGTPSHVVPQMQCQAEIDAETKACGTGAMTLSACLRDADRYDAEGCLPAWVAFLGCRAQATIDCSTGETSCDTAPSYNTCQSHFVQQTGCEAMGTRTDTCASGQYLYACLNGTAPFANCQSVQTGAAVPYFCCG